MEKNTAKRTFLLGALLLLGGCGEPDTRSFAVENAIFESVYLDRAVLGPGRADIAGGLAAICKGDTSGARRLIRESAIGDQIYRLALVAAKARRDGSCDYSDWQEKQTLLGDRFKQLVNSGDAAAVLLASLLDRSLAPPDRAKIVQALSDKRYGHAQAIHAGMLMEGDAAAKDYGKARELLEDAAKQGASPAYVLLARLHRDGLGTPRDPGKACKYLRDAANGGYESAAGELKKHCPQS